MERESDTQTPDEQDHGPHITVSLVRHVWEDVVRELRNGTTYMDALADSIEYQMQQPRNGA